MAEETGISWTDHTFNPWIGCQAVSDACDHCYAEALVKRWGGDFAVRRRTSVANWNLPLRWSRKAAAEGVRKRVFCSSLADVFDNQVPTEWRRDLWHLIAATSWLDWQLLTKRPQNIAKMLPSDWRGGLSNVWLGTTAENQTEFDRRWPHLSSVPAGVRFVSYEPALGPLLLPSGHAPDWVICGGESGPGARPMDPQWVSSIRDQCKTRGIAFFMKQTGSARGEWPGVTGKGDDPEQWAPDLRVRQFPEARVSLMEDALA